MKKTFFNTSNENINDIYSSKNKRFSNTLNEISSDSQKQLKFNSKNKAIKNNGKNKIEFDDFVSSEENKKTMKNVEFILNTCFENNYSDIHIEPKENRYKIRVRNDGLLSEFLTISASEGKQLVSCLKALADMDIAEKRSSQDGKIYKVYNKKKLEFRCSTVPGRNGESMVLRMLKSDSELLNLDSLINIKSVKDIFRKIIQLPNGIIIVSGPTGSGKSTTLAAALREIDKGDMKIVTIEDPIEYDLGGDIVQAEVNRAKGQTFPNLVRTFLRHDPDVILIGETRDPETAISSMDSSETGHLVFTTMHANSASSSLSRLLDMDVPKYKLNTSVRAVLAQRLIRSVCKSCSRKSQINDNDSIKTGIDPSTIITYANNLSNDQIEKRKNNNSLCKECLGSGYKGRIGVYELLVIDRKIQDAIALGMNDLEIEDIAIKEGMITLRKYGIELVKLNLTTVEELERVCKVY